jgi:hypothetical protein
VIKKFACWLSIITNENIPKAVTVAFFVTAASIAIIIQLLACFPKM